MNFDVLEEKVYLPAFLEKCAELGLEINDEETLTGALQAVAAIKEAEVAQTAAQPDLLKQANAELLGAAPVLESAVLANTLQDPEVLAALRAK